MASATAADAADPQLSAPIHQFIDSFNKGDAKAAAAAHVPGGVVIIDEVSPFAWQGPKAFETWAADLARNDKAQGVTDESVAVGEASREVVAGDRAYVVVPVVYTFKQKGVAMREAAQMSVALARGVQGWKIAGWAWTGPDPSPAK
ncbi:MAG TPA: nuclear transport factor 2 family protein [Phenylobacterium sp.]|nr:nuclear transport factor 2 family protein [Phenylobacterium sp.]